MSYSTSQLATAVLQEMGVLDATEAISTEDQAYITDVWSAKWEELSGHGVERTYFSYDDIPNAMFLTIRDLVINEVRGAFGRPISAVEKEQNDVIIMRRLRRHMATQASGRPVRAEYF